MTALLALLLATQEASPPLRWRHAGAPGAEEAGRKAAVDRIASWWREFARKEKEIDALFLGKAEWDLPAWMGKHLQGIHPALMWEYGPAIRGKGNRLVITPESRYHLQPLVEALLKAAPSLPGWEFYGHRLPLATLQEVDRLVESRLGRKRTLTAFAAARGTFNQVDLTFSAPTLQTAEDAEKLFSEAFLLVESLAGEENLNRWVGSLDIVPWKDRPAQTLTLNKLLPEIERHAVAVREGLPAEPLHRRKNDAEWTLFKAEPEPQADYAAQLDLFVGKALNTELWKNGRSKTPFSSARWSRAGETFCYVKLDGRQADQEAFPDKAAIEDALEGALRKAELGCFVGGGTGRIYSYVDLAVVDVAKAVPVIRQTLQKGKVSRRSWILFYDSELAWEWIGIWDDSPPPPRVEDR